MATLPPSNSPPVWPPVPAASITQSSKSPWWKPRRSRRWWAITTGVVVLIAIVGVAGSAGSKPAAVLVANVPAATAPTNVPTSAAPTAVPTAAPTAVPTAAPTAAPTDVPTAAPTVAPTAAPESQHSIVAGYQATSTRVTIAQLANSPSTYDGTTVSFKATIVNFLQDSTGATTAMNVSDPNDFTSLVYVQLGTFADVTQMNKGDTVTIWGDGMGDISGTNAYGGSINESAITEVYLVDPTSGYADDTDPNPV
jgi:hypothetical protein